jgi:hypothetical protein
VKLEWFARCEGIAKMGPFPSQDRASDAIMTTNGLPAPGAFVWSQQVAPKRRKTKRTP